MKRAAESSGAGQVMQSPDQHEQAENAGNANNPVQVGAVLPRGQQPVGTPQVYAGRDPIPVPSVPNPPPIQRPIQQPAVWPAPLLTSNSTFPVHANSSKNADLLWLPIAPRRSIRNPAPKENAPALLDSDRSSGSTFVNRPGQPSRTRAATPGPYSYQWEQCEPAPDVTRALDIAALVKRPKAWSEALAQQNENRKPAFVVETMKQLCSENVSIVFDYAKLLEPCCQERHLGFLQQQAFPEGRQLASVLVELHMNKVLAQVLNTGDGRRSLFLVCENGYSLLNYAALCRNAEATRIILNAYGPDNDIRVRSSKRGSLPLHNAADRDALDVARCLLERWGDEQRLTRNRSGELPIHLAIMHGGGIAMVELLLQERAYEQVTAMADALKQNALMLAVYYRAVEVVKLLLAVPRLPKAQLTMRDATGRNALDIAKAECELEAQRFKEGLVEPAEKEKYARTEDIFNLDLAIPARMEEPEQDSSKSRLVEGAQLIPSPSGAQILGLIEEAIDRLDTSSSKNIRKGAVMPDENFVTNLNDIPQLVEGKDKSKPGEGYSKLVSAPYGPKSDWLPNHPHAWFGAFWDLYVPSKITFCAISMFKLVESGGFARFGCKGILDRACRTLGIENLMKYKWSKEFSLAFVLCALHMNELLAELFKSDEGRNSLFVLSPHGINLLEESKTTDANAAPVSGSLSGYTVLNVAARFRNVEAVKLVLEHDRKGILRDMKTPSGELPIDYAKRVGADDIVAMLENCKPHAKATT